MVLKGEPVPVHVAPAVRPGRGRAVGRFARRVGYPRGSACACVSAVVGREAGHGEPPQRLTVAAGFERRAGFVIDLEVADVAVAAEDLDRGGGVHVADGVVDVAKGAGGFLLLGGVVADQEEEVDGSGGRVDDVSEPCLVDHG